MTNATKTLAILFAGTVALAAVTSWGGNGPSSAAFRGQLLSVDTSAVQTIRIERSDAPTVRLRRSDAGWAVAPTDTSATYPADARAVNQLLTTLPSLQVSAVATRQPDNHPRYGVDSTGTRITFLGGGETLGALIVGRTRIRRPQSQGRSQSPMQRMQRRRRGSPITYVRTPDRPDVYSVEQALRSVTRRGVEEWRDRRLWAVNRSNIQRVDFTFPGDTSFTMQRAAPGDTASVVGPSTWISRGDTLSSSEVSSVLRRLSSPQANGFATGTTPDELGNPRYRIRLHLKDGSQRTLRLYPPSDGAYRATAEGFGYVARLRTSTWNEVLRGRSAFLRGN
ncbi:MAG: DUF4340 domain-containing protein [Salinibacter sp.]